MSNGFSDPTRAGIFYAIALVLSLILAIFFAGQLGELTPLVTMLTPAAAVLVMLLLDSGDWRSREGLGALGVARTGVKVWPFAILGPVALLLLTDAIIVAAGLGSVVVPEASRPLVQTLVNVGLSLAIGLVFAFTEEVGWRGYMLPRLMGFGLVPAMLVVGFAHGVWHLPLMLLTPYYHSGGNPLLVVPLFLVTLTLAGIFYGYLRISSGSVWPVAIAHAVFNFTWSLGSEFVVPATPETMEYIGGESGVLMIAGLVVMAIVLVPRLQRMRVFDSRVLFLASRECEPTRSALAVTGAVVLLCGVPLAFLANLAFGGGASEILHVALGVSFLLFAAAVFDFRLPRWMMFSAGAAIGVLGTIFFLQAISDLTQSAWLANLAYAVLGQSLEKALGFAFLAWCAAVIVFDTRGATRTFGAIAVTVAVCVEIYGYAAGYFGSEPSPALKLLDLPIFLWLLLEGWKPRAATI